MRIEYDKDSAYRDSYRLFAPQGKPVIGWWLIDTDKGIVGIFKTLPPARGFFPCEESGKGYYYSVDNGPLMPVYPDPIDILIQEVA